jgi:hypothetical protein
MHHDITPGQNIPLRNGASSPPPSGVIKRSHISAGISVCYNHLYPEWTDIRFISPMPMPKRVKSLIPDNAKDLPVPTDNRKCLIMRPVLLELFWKPTYFRPKRTFASRRLLDTDG